MKNLLMIPSMALAFGLAGNAVADNTASSRLEVTPSSNQKMSHKTVSLRKTIDFYQGDFLSTRKASLRKLGQDDLYMSQGASESTCCRFVTD